jgi:pimeloyl-ACP methyl ester carboxylesterase
MLWQMLRLVLALPVSIAGVEAPDHTWLLGDWVGELRLGDEARLIKLQCGNPEDHVQVTVKLPPYGPAVLAVGKLHVTREAMSFELPQDDSALVFEGKLDASGLAGTVRSGTERGTFRMVRLGRVDARRLAACRGAYRVGPEHFLWVAPFGELGGDLFFVDSRSGRFGPLYAESDTTFFSGQTVAAAVFPVEVQIAFVREADGTVSGLTYRRGKSDAVRAIKVPLSTEAVRFRNRDVTLHGTLTMPRGAGPHPAVVLVHGSGPADRDFLGPWVELFASQGVAVLAYDKRGVGASGGDWKRATFHDLAGDAAAAVALLKSRSDVDARRVGLFGISQGGWVAPLTARLAPNIAFLILHAGPAVTVAVQGLEYLEQELRGYDLPRTEIDEAIALQKLDDAFTRSGEGWGKLQEAHQKAVGRKAEWVQPLRAKDDWFRAFYRGIMDHDPVPDLARLSCPVLAFFGELDHNVPPVPNKAILERALATGGNRDVTVVVLPKANHLFLQARTGTRAEYRHLTTFVPEYFESMTSWLRRRVLASR